MNVKNLLKGVDYKGLAIQHCEKVVIVVVTALLVMFLWNGVNKAMSASDITPDQIAQLADDLTKSVNKKGTWASSPDRDKVKNPDLDKQIQQLKEPVDSSQFRLSAPYYFNFVDFGGILRQKPDILKPYNLIAFADKGAVSLFKTDSKGNILEVEKVFKPAAKKKVTEEEKDTKKKTKSSAAKPNLAKGGKGPGGMSGMMGSMGGDGDSMADSMMMGGRGGMGSMGMGMRGGQGMGGSNASDSDSGEGMLGGNIGAGQKKSSGGSIRRNSARNDEEDFADDPPPGKAVTAPAVPGVKADVKAPITRKVPVEEIRGIRWAVITALYPHREQLQEYLKKLHTPDVPPVYEMVMVERREVLSDGSLSEWASIDLEKEAEIVRIMPEKKRSPERPEFVAANAIFSRLVMPLPELLAGKWTFHNQKAASKAAIEASTQVGGRGMGDGSMDGSEGDERSQEELNQEIFGGGAASGRTGPAGGLGFRSGGPGSSSGGGQAGPGMQMASGPGGSGGMSRKQQTGPGAAGAQGAGTGQNIGGSKTGTAKNQPKLQTSTAAIVQIRFIDYTVEPEHTYQYRLKVVVKNPNFDRIDIISDDVAKDKTLTSEDWSEPTNPVYVPTDTEYFVLERIRARDREEAKLQVHKWLADVGDWQLSDFTIKPGDPIGAEVPDYRLVDWEDRVKKTRFDFSTQDLLLDVTGGDKSFTFTVDGVEIKYNEKLPAEIFVIDRLGDLATRNEDFDKYNADRKEREAEITRLRKEAKDKEEPTKKGAANKPEAGGSEGFEERVPTRKPGS